jgi:aspartate aminotransferase
MKERGEPVIHLGGGEPVSRAPGAAIEAAQALLRTGAVRYTAPDGTLALKSAILHYTEEFYGRAAAPANVIASAGAKQAIQICLQAILDPGDEVVFPVPYWVSYPDMVRIAGGVPVPVPPPPGALLPSPEDLERHLSPKTRAFLLNSPNNPSGLCFPDALVAWIVDTCERRGIWLIADDIYHRLVFDGRRPASCWRHARDRSESSRLVLVNGVSKQYAMTGFRIGWAVACRPLIQAMTNLQSHQTSGPSTVGQAAAAAALTGPQDETEQLRRELEERRNVTVEALGRIPGVRLTAPDGTFYAFPDCSEHDPDSLRLAARLLERARVVTVPGIEFGLEGHLRLSYCGGLDPLREGLERIRWVLDPASPREIRIGDRSVRRDD